MSVKQEIDLQLCRRIGWDYQLPPEEIALLILGKKDRAGHYTRKDLFKKVLESYSWFTVLRLYSPEIVQELLTDEIIKSLRMPSLRQHYAFIRKRLQETLPVTG
jgi:hypothetical protein